MDRQFIARELGFIGGVCPNSMDAVSDRDYVLDTLYFAAVHLTHLSRWAEDLIIYSSGLFKFVQCSDAYATGGQAAMRVLCSDSSTFCTWPEQGIRSYKIMLGFTQVALLLNHMCPVLIRSCCCLWTPSTGSRRLCACPRNSLWQSVHHRQQPHAPEKDPE